MTYKVHIISDFSKDKKRNTALCNGARILTPIRNDQFYREDFSLDCEEVCLSCRNLYLSNTPLVFGKIDKRRIIKKRPDKLDSILYNLLKARRILTKQFNNRRHRPKYHKPAVPRSSPGDYLLQHPDCYLEEARAMLMGKHWEGKNRCVKLPGDDGADRTT